MVGQLEAAHLTRQRPGERAFLPPEQFALEERGRDRRAVHAHHRAGVPGAQLVNLRREQFLAGAGFAEQQDRRIGRRHELNLLQDMPDGAALAHNIAGALAFPGFRSKVDVLGVQLIAQTAGLFERPLERFVALPARQHTAERRRKDAQTMNHVRRPGALLPNAMKPTAPTTRPATDRGTVTADRIPSRAVAVPVDGVRYFIDILEAHEPASQNRFVHPRGSAR